MPWDSKQMYFLVIIVSPQNNNDFIESVDGVTHESLFTSD